MDFEPVNKVGELWADDVKPLLECLGDQSERSLDQVRDAASRPGLWMTRHRVPDRDAEFTFIKPCEKFRQLVILEVHGCTNDAHKEPHCLFVETVASEAGGDDGIVVRPDGAEMIAEGIVPSLVSR